MTPQPVVSTVLKRLKKEWTEDKARKVPKEFIRKKENNNVRSIQAGYDHVLADSQTYAHHPDNNLSKPLMKAMFDRIYVSYNVQMTKTETKHHKERQQSWKSP